MSLYAALSPFVAHRVAVTYRVVGGWTVSVGTVWELNEDRMVLRSTDRAIIIKVGDIIHVGHLPTDWMPVPSLPKAATPTVPGQLELPADAWKEGAKR